MAEKNNKEETSDMIKAFSGIFKAGLKNLKKKNRIDNIYFLGFKPEEITSSKLLTNIRIKDNAKVKSRGGWCLHAEIINIHKFRSKITKICESSNITYQEKELIDEILWCLGRIRSTTFLLLDENMHEEEKVDFKKDLRRYRKVLNDKLDVVSSMKSMSSVIRIHDDIDSILMGQLSIEEFLGKSDDINTIINQQWEKNSPDKK